MYSFYCLIILLIPLTLAYPRHHADDFDRFLDMYSREQLNKDNQANEEEFVVRRQNMFPFSPIQQQLPQVQPICLPQIWTCGPGLPECCPGLMCYSGNAKRGRHCVARG